MKILVQPATRKCSSDSCNYTCPVYNTGAEGLEELIKKLAKRYIKEKIIEEKFAGMEINYFMKNTTRR